MNVSFTFAYLLKIIDGPPIKEFFRDLNNVPLLNKGKGRNFFLNKYKNATPEIENVSFNGSTFNLYNKSMCFSIAFNPGKTSNVL